MTFRNRSAFLDTWRAVAVTMVISGHLAESRGVQAPIAWAGVFVFFFISGYVVSKSALREFSATGNFSARNFYLRRMFRIIPPLLLYLTTCLALLLIKVIDTKPGELLNSALYVCNVRLADCGWYVAHTWSLAFEEQFYLLFPLLFLFRVRRSWRLAAWAAGAALAALPAFIFPLPWVSRTGFLAVYALFGLGYWFARRDGWWRKWRYPNLMFAIGAAATFTPWSSLGAGRFALVVLIASIPVMVMSVDHPHFALRRAFSVPAVVLVGQASYSMYLWQQLFTGPPLASLGIAANGAVVAAMVTFCVVLYLQVERPIIRYSRTLARPRTDMWLRTHE